MTIPNASSWSSRMRPALVLHTTLLLPQISTIGAIRIIPSSIWPPLVAAHGPSRAMARRNNSLVLHFELLFCRRCAPVVLGNSATSFPVTLADLRFPHSIRVGFDCRLPGEICSVNVFRTSDDQVGGTCP